MISNTKTCDVFISHAPPDAELARSVAETFRHNGLEAVTDAEVGFGENASDEVWEALTDSKALVVVLSRSEPSPTMAVEIGAAQAWSKPIYGIAADPSSTRLPPSLSRVRLLAPASIDEIIRDLKRVPDALTDESRRLLAKAYSESGVAVDELSLNRAKLQIMTERFNKAAGKKFSDTELLRELLIMRKRGQLPRLARKSRSSRRSSA